MPNTTFVDGGAPVTAAWLNDINFVIYDLIGNGTLVPASRTELLSNIGAGGGGGGGSGNATSQQEIAPTSPTIGDLWQQPSTGLMSRWNGTAWIVFGDIAKPDAAAAAAEAATALSTANTANTTATSANTAITAIASDNVLSSGEKSAIILDYNTLSTEAVGIDNQATAFAVTTEKTAYDNALNALTAFLATLTTPTLWSDVTGNTTIVGTTFRTNFANVYAARQTLLNKIAAVAKAIADSGVANAATAASAAATAQTAATNAQNTANTASANATSALNQLTNIASDNVLSQVEKPAVILDYTNLTGEQTDIDAKATAYAISTQKSNYDSALATLTSYLGGLSSPVAWNNLTGDTTVVGTTFRTNFAAVYSTRQLLLNEIARVAGTVATWAGVSGVAVTTSQIVAQAVNQMAVDAHDFAGALIGLTSGYLTQRTILFTPTNNCTIVFQATLGTKNIQPDSGLNFRFTVTPAGGGITVMPGAANAGSQFTTQNQLYEFAAVGGVQLTFTLDVNNSTGGGQNITLNQLFVLIIAVNR